MSARYRTSQRMAVACAGLCLVIAACANAEYDADPDDSGSSSAGASGKSAAAGKGGTAPSRGGNSSGGTLSSGGSGGRSNSAGSSGSGIGTGSGGVAGKGGSSASGGSVSSGGATQGGSSGQAGTAAQGGTGPVAVDGLSIKYKALNAGARAAAIECQVVIANTGALTIPLSEFTLRYYFTSEVPAPIVEINWAGLNPGFTDLKGSLVTSFTKLVPSAPGADSYVDLGFSGSAPAISPGKTAEISWKAHAEGYAIEFIQTGDYSFDASKAIEPVAWEHVVLLRNGNVVWGSPP
jgi:hypothetical protein